MLFIERATDAAPAAQALQPELPRSTRPSSQPSSAPFHPRRRPRGRNRTGAGGAHAASCARSCSHCTSSRSIATSSRGCAIDFDPPPSIVHEGDALEFDFASLGPSLRVVGNLPVPHLHAAALSPARERAHALRDIHVMLQREVVERMVAAPGSSDYGRLSVMLQYRFEMEEGARRSAPTLSGPPPKVESAVVRMIPRRCGSAARARRAPARAKRSRRRFRSAARRCATRSAKRSRRRISRRSESTPGARANAVGRRVRADRGLPHRFARRWLVDERATASRRKGGYGWETMGFSLFVRSRQ